MAKKRLKVDTTTHQDVDVTIQMREDLVDETITRQIDKEKSVEIDHLTKIISDAVVDLQKTWKSNKSQNMINIIF
jgi:hypothetical protein